MKQLLLLLAIAASAWAQVGVFPPASTGGGGVTPTQGTFASLSGTCSANGLLYLFTDAPYSYATCPTTNTLNYFLSGIGNATLPPATSSFTAVNFTGAAFTTTKGGILFTAPTNAGDSIRYQYVAAPATPWTITMAFIPKVANANYNFQGLSFSDGTKFVNCWYGFNSTTPGAIPGVQAYTSATTTSAGTLVGTFQTLAPWGSMPLLLKAGDDGTNLSCSFSVDGGQNFITYYSASETAFLSAKPTQIGPSIDNNNATYTSEMYILSWLQQ